MKFLLPLVLVLTLIALAQSNKCDDKPGGSYRDCQGMYMCMADGTALPLAHYCDEENRPGCIPNSDPENCVEEGKPWP